MKVKFLDTSLRAIPYVILILIYTISILIWTHFYGIDLI